MRRIAVWMLLTFLASLLSLIIALAWSMGTTSGTRALLNLLGNAVPGFSIESLQGQLAGSLQVQNVRYADDSLEVSIDSMELDWSPSRLLARRFDLQRLELAGVALTQLPAAPHTDDKEEEEFLLPRSIDLPIDVIVRKLVLRDVDIRSEPQAQPFVISKGELSASFVEQHLAIDLLSLRGPLFAVSVNSEILARDEFPLKTEIEWTAEPPEFAAATGQLVISGDLNEMKLEHRVATPYRLDQSVTLRNVVDALSFEAVTRIKNLRLADIADSLPDITLIGTLHGQGGVDDFGFKADMQAEASGLAPFAVQVSGGFTDRVLAVSQLLLTSADELRVAVDGSIDLRDASPEMQLQGQWQELPWPLGDDARVIASNGLATLNGPLNDYALMLRSQLRVPGQTEGSLELLGSGNTQSFEVSGMKVALPDGKLRGAGRLRWAPNLEASVALNGTDIDPAVLAKDLPGELQFELQASGASRDGEVFARLDAARVFGTLRQQPLDMRVAAQLEEGLLRLQELRLSLGETLLNVHGQASDSIDFDWTVDSPDLGELIPQATGSIQGEGSVEGTVTLPSLSGSLQGADIAYGHYLLQTLLVQADVDLQRPTASSLLVSLEQGAAGDVTLNKLELTGHGTGAAHELELAVDTSLGAAGLRLKGQIEDHSWVAQLARGRVQYAGLDPWVLGSPHSLEFNRDGQQLGEGCWFSEDSRLCFKGLRAADRFVANLDLQDFALAYLQPLLPSSMALEGRVDGSVSVARQVAQELELDAVVNAENVLLQSKIGGAQSEAAQPLLAFDPSRLRLLHSAEGLSVNLAAPLTGAGGVTGELEIEPGKQPLGERALQGLINVNLPHTQWMSALSPELQHVAGELRGQFNIGGSFNAPATQGFMTLRDGELQLATPGLDISAMSVDARVSGPQALEFNGEAQSGEGSLNLAGSVRLGASRPEIELSIDGDAFQVVNNRDARVYVSPDLRVAIGESGTRVTGSVRVPRAEITPRKLPDSAVAVSADQLVVTGDASDVSVVSPGVEANIRVQLGDDVRVDGFGFKGRLDGTMVVESSPHRPTLGTGELNIRDGEYRAYGQGLVIEEGRILFAGGPIDQPGVKLRAVRRPASDILVGVSVRGALEEPEFSLFSQPAMSQTETLSWLVLGRPLTGSSEGQEDMLAQAATMLGIKGGNYLADRFGEDLGVDSIGIETGSGEAGAESDVNQAALVIGKYLSPDLFVSYGIGLFDSISTLKLDYSLNKNWSLSTESSTEASGGDVNYVIER